MVNEDNRQIGPLVDQLRKVINYKSYSLVSFQLEYILPMVFKDFYRYSGSLTTPGCDEVVLWNVADTPFIELSENQLLEFQSLLDPHGFPILSNARPVQSLNDRVIQRSFKVTSKSHI